MQKPLFLVKPPCSRAVSTLVMLLILLGIIGLLSEPIRISAGSDYRVAFSYFISGTMWAAAFAVTIQLFMTANAYPAGKAYIGNLCKGRASP